MNIKHHTISVLAIIIGLLLVTITGSAGAESASNLEIINLSGTNINLSQEDLQTMPTTTVYAELYCEGSLVTNGNWTGILLSDLLIKAQLSSEVSSVQLTASDGYTVTIPIELAMQPQTIIAYQKDGQSLIEGLRLILVESNGGAWISLITRMAMSSSAIDYPPGVTVGTGKFNDLANAQSSQTPEKLSPQQPPTPKNSSSIQVSAPINITSSPSPISKPQLSNNVDKRLDPLIYVAVVIVSMMVGSAVVLTQKRKRNLQKLI